MPRIKLAFLIVTAFALVIKSIGDLLGNPVIYERRR